MTNMKLHSSSVSMLHIRNGRSPPPSLYFLTTRGCAILGWLGLGSLTRLQRNEGVGGISPTTRFYQQKEKDI